MFNTENSSDDETSSASSDGIAIPYIVRFWLYLFFEIISLVCSVFVLGHFLYYGVLRRAIYNHVIIILLIINLIVQLTDIPWILNYYRLGEVQPATPSFCIVWVFMDEALYLTTTILFAWATLERHILIFHDQWISTRIKLLLIHYLPIAFLSLYCVCYSFIVIIFPPCENTFDYTTIVCGSPLCYYDDEVVAFWDIVINHLVPSLTIIFCSLALFVRILYQKKRMHQPIRWRKHRKMAIQLLSITFLYLIIYIPDMILEFVYLCGVSETIGKDFMLYAEFFSYCGTFIFPFVCAASLPNLKSKIKNMFPYWRQQRRTIGPRVFSISQKTDARFAKGITVIH